MSLGALLGASAIFFGIILSVRHLPSRSAAPNLASEATANPGANLQAQLESARHELEAGHYATAEALFRELGLSVSNVQPAAELCAALQLWERGDFAQAATALRRFLEIRPLRQFAWLNDFKPLAQNRL
jgi:predicted Zn-dependent protease